MYAFEAVKCKLHEGWPLSYLIALGVEFQAMRFLMSGSEPEKPEDHCNSLVLRFTVMSPWGIGQLWQTATAFGYS